MRLAVALLVAGLIALAASHASPSAGAEELFELRSSNPEGISLRTIDGYGEWTGEFSAPAEPGRGDEWYVIDIAGVIDLGDVRQVPGGRVYVVAATNDRAAIQFKLKNAEASDFVEWSTTDLFEGTRRGFTTDGRLAFHGRNYLQITGARAGRNTLSLSVEEVSGLTVKGVWIAPSTRIERVSVGPPELNLDVTVRTDSVQPGQRFNVDYVLTNGGAVAKDVVLQALVDGTRITAPDQTLRRDQLSGSERGTLTFDAVEVGPSSIEILADGSNSDGARKTIFIDVGASPPSEGRLSPRSAGLAAGAVGLLILTAVIVTGRSKRETRANISS